MASNIPAPTPADLVRDYAKDYEIAEAAKRGPWVSSSHSSHGEVRGPNGAVAFVGYPANPSVMDAINDQAHIANSRTALPAAIRTLAEYRRLLRECVERIDLFDEFVSEKELDYRERLIEEIQRALGE